VGTLEGAATLPKDGGWATETQRPKPALPGARNIFFDRCCDRPGCYEGFAQQRRSPLQRFCSQGCRRALERVEERERRWKQARI
jgi:hypothetical protein